MKISVILQDAEAERFSAYCDEHAYKKSTLICRLIREHLENEGFGLQGRLSFERDKFKGD